VVGINAAIVAAGQVVGFAIPINLVKDILTQLHEEGRVTRGGLGVQVQQVTPELATSFGLEHGRGALVADAQPNSPAAQARIQHGDIVLGFNGEPIKSVHTLAQAFKALITFVETLAQAGRSRRVDDDVVGDTSQPSCQARFTLKSADASIGAAEHFLGQVFTIDLSVCTVAQPCLDESAQRFPLSFTECLPHLTIMFPQGLYEFRGVETAMLMHHAP
jgi:PDZ domain